MTSRVEELQRMCDNINENGGLDSGEWHTALLAQIAQNLAVIADVMMAYRKVENSSKKPNICEDEPQTDCGDFADRLAYERGIKHAWEVAQKVFDSTVTFYEAEDVAKQIDKDINVRSKDEPQTDCAWK